MLQIALDIVTGYIRLEGIGSCESTLELCIWRCCGSVTGTCRLGTWGMARGNAVKLNTIEHSAYSVNVISKCEKLHEEVNRLCFALRWRRLPTQSTTQRFTHSTPFDSARFDLRKAMHIFRTASMLNCRQCVFRSLGLVARV